MLTKQTPPKIVLYSILYSFRKQKKSDSNISTLIKLKHMHVNKIDTKFEIWWSFENFILNSGIWSAGWA